MRDRPVISIENYTIYCGDADENKVGGCAIAVRNDYKNLVEEFGTTSSGCAFLRLRDHRGRKLWIASAHAPTERAEGNSKDAFYDELNALMQMRRWDSNSNPMCKENGIIQRSARRTTGNHRRHQLKRQGSTLLTPEEQRKRQMRALKLQLDYVLARNIPDFKYPKIWSCLGRRVRL
ncbi:hypothetical protein RB195_021632 [Necator americanus]|uniref:Uncharacterized protein n=1 Tax=Necator americanus TaxID=51031 RepID=A0ABR1EEK5_NECAM